MIRRTVNTFALGLIVISAVYSTANAQTSSYVVDTGVIDLAPGQTLRVSLVSSEAATVRFKKLEYVESDMIDGVVRKQVASQSTSSPVSVSGDQCLVFFLGGMQGSVRVQIYASTQNFTARAFVVGSASGGNDIALEELTLTHQGFKRD